MAKIERMFIYPLLLVLSLSALGVPLPFRLALAAGEEQPSRDDVAFRHVRCESLVIVGGGGKDLVTLRSEAAGGSLRLHGAKAATDAPPAVTLEASEQGEGRVNVQGGGGARLQIGSGPRGSALTILGPKGVPRAVLGTHPTLDAGVLRVWGSETSSVDVCGVGSANHWVCRSLTCLGASGRAGVTLSADADGGQIAAYTEGGAGVALLGVSSNGAGIVRVLTPQGAKLAEAGMDEGGGGILNVFNARANIGCQVGADGKQHGYLWLLDEQGRPTAKLGTYSGGESGALWLYVPQSGVPVVDLGSFSDGDGGLTAKSRDGKRVRYFSSSGK